MNSSGNEGPFLGPVAESWQVSWENDGEMMVAWLNDAEGREWHTTWIPPNWMGRGV